MPYDPTSYTGWSEDWLGVGKPQVSEAMIKCFVNRYFAYPEDWDDDDIPLIMLWVRCINCGFVREHFVQETEEAWDDFIYNHDNTYTSFSNPECITCISSADNHLNLNLQEERRKLAEIEYLYQLLYKRTEEVWHFDSVIEDYFWKVWRTTFPYFTLIPQYQIGNYFVDFAHVPTKTVIELDGKAFHTTPNQKAHDQARQIKIELQGWRFLRFQGREIYHHVDRCTIETVRFLSQVSSGLIAEVRFQWRSSPSARLLMKLQSEHNTF